MLQTASRFWSLEGRLEVAQEGSGGSVQPDAYRWSKFSDAAVRAAGSGIDLRVGSMGLADELAVGSERERPEQRATGC